MVCSKNIRTNSIVYFEKNEFNYNVRKNKDINTHVRLRIIWRKKRYLDNMPVGCLQIYQIENDIDIDINVYLPITWERN